MEYSDFLDLNLPSSSDYAGHWEVPLNGSLIAIDDHAEAIATELLADPTDGYIGQLKRTHLSLEARLDSIEDGGLIFNNNDLEKSRYSRKPWTPAPTDINGRITKCEESEYVENSLKGSVATGAGFVPYAKDRLDRLSGSGVKGRRYSSGSAVDLDNFYFRNASASTLITHTALNELTFGALGLMQIGGNLYHHTRTGTVAVTDAGSHTYMVTATASNPAATLDCQLIRSSLSAGCSGGYFSEGGWIFDAGGLVNIDDPEVGNNHWKPAVGQLLRINFGGTYYDYTISAIGPGNGTVQIYGRFEIDSAGVAYDWEIYDLTQPCISVTEILAPNITEYVMEYSYYKMIPELVLAVIHVEAGNIRVTHPIQTDYIGKSLLLNPTFASTGHIGVGGVLDMELDGIAAANIKDIKIITVEQIREIAATDVYHYVTSINPKRRVTIAGAGDFFMDSFHVVHYGTIESNTADQIVNVGTVGPGAGSTVIRLVHPDYGDAANTYWSYDPSVVAYPINGYTLMYLGILVELI